MFIARNKLIHIPIQDKWQDTRRAFGKAPADNLLLIAAESGCRTHRRIKIYSCSWSHRKNKKQSVILYDGQFIGWSNNLLNNSKVKLPCTTPLQTAPQQLLAISKGLFTLGFRWTSLYLNVFSLQMTFTFVWIQFNLRTRKKTQKSWKGGMYTVTLCLKLLS